jgi:cAMP phosphodiesterase
MGDSQPTLQVIVLGSGGGPNESNTSAFLVRSVDQEWRKGSLVAVDAGVHLSAISRIIKEALPCPPPSLPHTLSTGPFAGLTLPHSNADANAQYIAGSLVDAYLITHPHLDHIAAVLSLFLSFAVLYVISSAVETLRTCTLAICPHHRHHGPLQPFQDSLKRSRPPTTS